jgi:hypothetical protein
MLAERSMSSTTVGTTFVTSNVTSAQASPSAGSAESGPASGGVKITVPPELDAEVPPELDPPVLEVPPVAPMTQRPSEQT